MRKNGHSLEQLLDNIIKSPEYQYRVSIMSKEKRDILNAEAEKLRIEARKAEENLLAGMVFVLRMLKYCQRI